MGRHFLTEQTEEQMRKNAERAARKQWKGEVAGPRTFYKNSQYTGEDLRNTIRRTALDDAPSLMGDMRRYRDGRVEKIV